jgi:hypothetical protein
MDVQPVHHQVTVAKKYLTHSNRVFVLNKVVHGELWRDTRSTVKAAVRYIILPFGPYPYPFKNFYSKFF